MINLGSTLFLILFSLIHFIFIFPAAAEGNIVFKWKEKPQQGSILVPKVFTF